MKPYPAIMGAFYNTPHAITRNKLNEIDAVLQRRVSGGEPRAMEFDAEAPRPVVQLVSSEGQVTQLTAEQLAAEQIPAGSAGPQEFVAVLPLFGTLMQHASFESDFSGGTSTEQWQRQFRRLDQNAAVKTIVIETHSPGGQCIGVEETADLVRGAREPGRTRVVSVANSMMASAAVWIGTAAKEVYVTPGGEIGSVGVVCLHWDYSKAYEAAGMVPTLIATSREKIRGNEFEPLDDETRAQLEADNQTIYQRFVKSMAANRGVSTAKVESDFGGGGMLWAKDAVKAGLADGVMTMAAVMEKEVARLNKSAAKGGRKSVRNQLAIEQAKQL